MAQFISSNQIRSLFSRAMSDMYGVEVPAYKELMSLVADINEQTLNHNPQLKEQLAEGDNLHRITEERHGAIRLGKPEELHTMRRLFAVMGMYPVSYYDLSVAGIPVHSTAFRPIEKKHLSNNPFRVFTSLLRLDLLENKILKQQAEEILNQRDIFSARARELIDLFEQQGGLTKNEANEFITEALKTFSWHNQATVSDEMYQKLHGEHRLVADVVSFKGPHINHLTPRTLDIDSVQTEMPQRDITPKEVIEGPPPRKCPILLRQTSFKALEEAVSFKNNQNEWQKGYHTARFGEIEQRGVALTPKGRALYDELLVDARETANQDKSISYEDVLAKTFKAFPDDWETLRTKKLAYFEYHKTTNNPLNTSNENHLDTLIKQGNISYTPITYEDFLPVSAAGIFQSNLDNKSGENFKGNANKDLFEQILGTKVADEFTLYQQIESDSIKKLFQ